MRKKLNKVFVSILVMFTVFSGFANSLVNVSANVTNIQPTGYTHTGQAWNPNVPGASSWFSGQSIDKITTDTGVGVCIEPWTLVEGWTGYTVSAYDRAELSRIWYYAYVNTNQTMYDYAVGQLMIWEHFGYVPTSHTVPNYASRKAEINNAISNYYLRPSFDKQSITINVGESVTLTDTNGVLSQFQGTQSNLKGISVSRNGNQLTISATADAESTSTFSWNKIPSSMVGQSFVHRKSNGQDIATLMRNDPTPFDLNIRVVAGRVKFNKTGEVFTHTLTGSTDAGTFQEPIRETQKLLGAEITICAAEQINDHSNNKLYDKNQVVDIVESTYDDDYSDWLPEGKYYWYESKVPFGYVEDLSKHYFEITSAGGSNQIINADLYNDRAEQLLVFSKQMEKHNIEKYQNNEAYKDVVFGIFTRDDTYNYHGDVAIPYDTMVAQFIIDSEGNAKSSVIWNDINSDGIEQDDELTYTDLKLNLPIGNYYIKELKTNWAYELDPKEYDFEVSYGGSSMQNITLIINDGEVITNELKDYKIQVNKVDVYTNEVIKSKDFEFTLYSNRECTEVVETVNANTSNGTAIFKNIHNGQYWIKETKAPVGYLLSDEIVKLEINENGIFINDRQIQSENDIYSFVYANEMIPMVETGDTTNVNTFVSLLLLSGITFSVMLFRKKMKFR